MERRRLLAHAVRAVPLVALGWALVALDSSREPAAESTGPRSFGFTAGQWRDFANRTVPPEAFLRSEKVLGATSQQGHLIGYTWPMDGGPTEATPWAPLQWPNQGVLESRHLLLEIDTPIPPVRIGLSLKQTPDGGVGSDAVEWNCSQADWEELGGTRPDCLIETEDGSRVIVRFDLPQASEHWFIATEAVWLLPPDSPDAQELPIRQAWWTFAVDTEPMA